MSESLFTYFKVHWHYMRAWVCVYLPQCFVGLQLWFEGCLVRTPLLSSGRSSYDWNNSGPHTETCRYRKTLPKELLFFQRPEFAEDTCLSTSGTHGQFWILMDHAEHLSAGLPSHAWISFLSCLNLTLRVHHTSVLNHEYWVHKCLWWWCRCTVLILEVYGHFQCHLWSPGLQMLFSSRVHSFFWSLYQRFALVILKFFLSIWWS